MTPYDPIKFIPHKEIDKIKWDHCIEQSENSRIYAYSNYLDAMAGKWDALVWGDYQIVMPVTANKKWGIQYLYQPAFTAQLGIFGHNMNFQIQRLFLESLNDNFKWIEIDLNSGNFETFAKDDRYFLQVRNNYVLHLNASYESLQKKYRPFIRKKIRDAHQNELSITEAITFDTMMKVVTDQPFHKKYMKNKLQEQFRSLYESLRLKQAAHIYAVKNKNEEIIATAVFFFSKNRYYYILAANSTAGKNAGASHFLIDHFIQKHANENCILDFEGSDKKELAFFYNSFGAELEPYPAMRKQELSWWVKWMKRMKTIIQS